jgi:hypothetical protein
MKGTIRRDGTSGLRQVAGFRSQRLSADHPYLQQSLGPDDIVLDHTTRWTRGTAGQMGRLLHLGA